MSVSGRDVPICLAAIGIVLIGVIAGWPTPNGKPNPVVERSLADSWENEGLPPIYSSELANSLLLTLLGHYAASADANGISEIAISPELGLFCLLSPESRKEIYLSRTKRLTPEGLLYLGQLVERCGLIVLKKQGGPKKSVFLAYYASGNAGAAAEITANRRDADIVVTVTTFTAGDVDFRQAAFDKARAYVSP